mgnify:CR=1 FL=1
MVYEIDDEENEVGEVEEENTDHSNPPRQVVEVDRLTHSGELVLLDPTNQNHLYHADNEKEEQHQLEDQFVDVTLAGDVGPRETEPYYFHHLQSYQNSDLCLLVIVKDGQTQNHQELLVVGENMIVVGPEEMFW